jgi:class 3 adenylate cyclase
LKITQEVRAFMLDLAERRCECAGSNCRHHLRGARCKHGLRGDDWRVYWRREDGGVTRGNLEAWCLRCFENNFDVPHETVALLAADIAGYAALLEDDQRKAITLKSVLRDAAERTAKDSRGRVVFDRKDDDILMEFPTSQDAIDAVRSLRTAFHDLAGRLRLPTPELCGALHYGQVTRWRNGMLAGEAMDTIPRVRSLAADGQIVITGPAAAPVQGKVELQPIANSGGEVDIANGLWTLRIAG